MKKITLTLLTLLIFSNIFSQELEVFRNRKGKIGFRNEKGKKVIPARYDNYIDYKVGINDDIKFKILGINSKKVRVLEEISQTTDPNNNEGVSFIIRDLFLPQGEHYILYNGKISEPYNNVKVLQNFSNDMEEYTRYSYKPIIEYNNNIIIDSISRNNILDTLKQSNIKSINEKLKNKYYPCVVYEKLPSNLLFIVEKEGKWGIVNSKFETVLNIEYDKIDIFPDFKTFKVWRNDKTGVINLNNEAGIPIKYNWYDYQINNNFRLVFNGSLDEDNYPKVGEYGAIDSTGKEIVPIKYNKAESFAVFGENPDFTIFSNNSETKEFVGHFSLVKTYGIDFEEKLMLKYSLKEKYTIEGEFTICINGKISKPYQNIKVLTKNDEINFDFDVFDENAFFYEVLVVDTSMQITVNSINEFTKDIHKGLDYDYDKVKKLNSQISGIKKQQVFLLEGQPKVFFIVKENNKWGVINDEYKAVIPFEYDEINSYSLNNSFCFRGVKNNQNICFDTEGEIIKEE